MAIISQNIDDAVKLILANDIVAIPTETVYGLAGNALNEDAILKIYTAKSRPSFNPLIAHIDSIDKVVELAYEIPNIVYDLFEAYSPGPITILLKKREAVPYLLTSGSNKVALRIPNHNLTLQLLKECGLPLAAPSANPFGYVSPTNPNHVAEQLGDKIKLILDGGQCQIGIESTIIEIIDNEVIFHRLGAITPEIINKDFSQLITKIANEGKDRPIAPGQLKSHYTPNKKCLFGNFDELVAQNTDKKLGAIRFSSFSDRISVENQILLSVNEDMFTAAKNLFSALREVEKLNCDIVILEELPNIGIGRAINDRLQRASS